MDFFGNACFHYSSVQIYVHVISVNNGKRVRLLLYAENDVLIA